MHDTDLCIDLTNPSIKDSSYGSNWACTPGLGMSESGSCDIKCGCITANGETICYYNEGGLDAPNGGEYCKKISRGGGGSNWIVSNLQKK